MTSVTGDTDLNMAGQTEAVISRIVNILFVKKTMYTYHITPSAFWKHKK